MNWKNKTVTWGALFFAIGLGFTYNIPKFEEPLFFAIHTHGAFYFNENRKAVNVVMDNVIVRDDIKSAEFKVYVNKTHLYNLYRLKGQMDETERQIEIQKTKDAIKKHSEDVIEFEKKRDNIGVKWKDYQVAVNYKTDE